MKFHLLLQINQHFLFFVFFQSGDLRPLREAIKTFKKASDVDVNVTNQVSRNVLTDFSKRAF